VGSLPGRWKKMKRSKASRLTRRDAFVLALLAAASVVASTYALGRGFERAAEATGAYVECAKVRERHDVVRVTCGLVIPVTIRHGDDEVRAEVRS
jgi:hypothetical protein